MAQILRTRTLGWRAAITVAVLAFVVAAEVSAPAATAPCGDFDASGTIAASDALLLLKAAVGHSVVLKCSECTASGISSAGSLTAHECGDVDGSGRVTASDALLLLKRAVGQPVDLRCPPCSTSTTTSTTVLPQLPRSQELIVAALSAGEIDYPTSLVYRVWALFRAPELPEAYDGGGSLGEDFALFVELSRVRESLPAEIEQRIAPYLVRPTDPTSTFSQPRTPVEAVGARAAGATPPPVGCDLNDQGEPDWRAYDASPNFVVWSCGSGWCTSGDTTRPCTDNSHCDSSPGSGDGICGPDPDASRREVASKLADAVLAAMKSKVGEPKPDDYFVGPGDQRRIDIYILRPNQCRVRGGFCNPIPEVDGYRGIAAAVAATPCGRNGGDALTSSGYIIIDAAQVPTAVPASGTPSEFRYSLAHEMFHLLSYNLNISVQGFRCAGTRVGDSGENSWLSEASAEWASFAFFAKDLPLRRRILFKGFQLERDQQTDGLQQFEAPKPYEAFLYPLFMQQESGGTDLLLNVWKTSSAARSAEDFDRHLNGMFSFAEHFRDFAVRGVNRADLGVTNLFNAIDSAIGPGIMPFVTAHEPALAAGMKIEQAAEIAPLFMQYEKYSLDDSVRWASFDVSPLGNSEHSRIDVLAKVDAQWQHEKVDGSVFTFCREDKDISELYFILSNHDIASGGKITGEYTVETKSFCPGGWSGHIRLVQKLTETSSRSFGGGDYANESRSIREEHRWSITGSEEFTPQGYPPEFKVEKLSARWHGEKTLIAESESYFATCGTATSAESGSNGGSGESEFLAYPGYAPSTYTLTPYFGDYQNPREPGSFTFDVIQEGTDCHGESFTSEIESTVPEATGLLAQVKGLAVLEAQGNDAIRFAGQETIAHEEQPLSGGESVYDVTVYWSLSRSPRR